MSQNLEMKELKDWLNDPTALKFKKILVNLRQNTLEGISHNYLVGKNKNFNKDFVLSSLGGCEAWQFISIFLGNSKEEELENLLKFFYGGQND